jgi:hypothetical protein
MERMRRIIISAADAKFYLLLQDLITSIRVHSDIAIGILDVGLEPTQVAELGKVVQHIVRPGWDFPVTGAPSFMQAMTARPVLPNHFPAYDAYMWMDADTWVQRWSAVEAYFDKAASHDLAIAQEMDRAYANVYNMNNSRKLFIEELRARFGDGIAGRIYSMPIVNSGVFAMTAKSRYWGRWRRALSSAIANRGFSFFTEQTALNVAIYDTQPVSPFPHFMPARFNWLCCHAAPLPDEKQGLLVEPLVPHDVIGIIHATSGGAPSSTCDSFTYSQWSARRMEFRALVLPELA